MENLKVAFVFVVLFLMFKILFWIKQTQNSTFCVILVCSPFFFVTFWIKQQAIGCDHYIKSIPSHYNNNNNNNNNLIIVIIIKIIIIIITITITDLI